MRYAMCIPVMKLHVHLSHSSILIFLCLYILVLGSEQHSEKSSVRMVLCWVTPTGKNHLAVPMWDPSEDQPVRSLSYVQTFPFYLSLQLRLFCLILQVRGGPSCAELDGYQTQSGAVPEMLRLHPRLHAWRATGGAARCLNWGHSK